MSNKIIKVLLFVLFVTTPWVASMAWITTKCSPAEGGTISSLGGYEYKAIPNSGYVFSHWKMSSPLVDHSPSSNPYDFYPFLMAYGGGDFTLTAYFEETIDPTWQILYTSTDGNVVTPNKTDVFGANIVSNTYQDGQGVITFDGPVKSIGEEAFLHCSSLTSITIPNSVTSIGQYAFEYCSSLTSITIPNSVTSIGVEAFLGCSSLTSINVDINNPNYSSVDGVLFNKDKTTLIQYPIGNSRSEYTIPNSVTSIGEWAFFYCSSLTSVTIPNSVTSIGSDAFSYCYSLTSITIPNSVTSIGYSAFSGCYALTSMIVENGNTTYDSREGCNAIIETETNTLIAGCQNTVIPNSVKSIGNYAFFGCESLTSFTIPNSVTSIGYSAFSGCYSLTSITIPNSVTSIGEGAFFYCSSLTSITIPEGVTSIGRYAFTYCYSITSITIPYSVTSIGDSAFYFCSDLTSITCKATTPPTLGEYAFYYKLKTAYIPCGTKSAYEASDWASYSITSFIEEGCIDPTWQILYTSTNGNVVTPYVSNFGANIVSNEYKDGQGIITLDGPATRIGNHTFKNCSSLKSITIPNSVTTLDMYAFESCTSLTSITIPEGVISIGEHAFYNCTALNPINLPDNLASIGDYAFYFCSSLTSITLPESLTSIGKGAFADCSSLTSITIPNGITSIADAIFSDCSSLSSITLHEGVTSIGQGAFEGCTSLTSFTIPEGITKIAKSTFNGCSALTSITIPEGITSIDGYAFWGCSGLTYIISKPTTPPTCGNNAFWNMDNTIPVYVPCGCVNAYKAAMNWKFFKNFQSSDQFTITVQSDNNSQGTVSVEKN